MNVTNQEWCISNEEKFMPLSANLVYKEEGIEWSIYFHILMSYYLFMLV